MKKYILIFLLCHIVSSVYGVTLVYNLKIRRIFSLPPLLERYKDKLITSLAPIYYFRKRTVSNATIGLKDYERRNVGGLLLDMHYAPDKNWWFEGTTAVATDHAKYTGTDPFCASRTGFDDVVLSAGYRYFWDCCQFVAYGLAGFPTRTKVSLDDRYGAFVGTRLFSVGVGGEASYGLLNSLKRSLDGIFQVRVIHGFNRSYTPVLPSNAALQPGNVTDLLFTLQYREKRTVFEAGYNPTFFTHGAIIAPTGNVKAGTIIRNGGYFSISHAFRGLFNKFNVVGGGFNGNRTASEDGTTVSAYLFYSIVF